jgi:hypothetical protein
MKITCLAFTPATLAGMSHEEHLRSMQKDEELERRGALAMGFDQDKVVHHFLLRASGGSIVVTTRNRDDAESLAQVRSHLREITAAFGKGVFARPAETHGELPPGAAIMAANRRLIVYRYKERADGAEVVIESSDANTLEAIHEFLRYQIVEHKTGDPLSASPQVRVTRPGETTRRARVF